MSENIASEILIEVTGNSATIIGTPILTSGMVGLPVRFQFDSQWDGLTKVAVFRAGEKTLDRMNIIDETTVPPEILRKNCALFIGVYGANGDGTLVIPTIYVNAGTVQPGADPSGDESADPTLPVWQNLQNQVGALQDLTTGDKSSLVAAVNELHASGVDGKSAYDIAVENGFEGTEVQWLASLQGDDYVLTPSDKTEIAEQAAAQIDTDLLNLIGSGVTE